MTEISLIIAYFVVQLLHTHMFFKQRAALEIGRQMQKEIGHLVLPSWFHTISFVLGAGKVAILGYLCYLDHWIIALCLGVALIGVCTFLPVPKKYYDDVHEKLKNSKIK